MNPAFSISIAACLIVSAGLAVDGEGAVGYAALVIAQDLSAVGRFKLPAAFALLARKELCDTRVLMKRWEC
jgi:hypothetical protein